MHNDTEKIVAALHDSPHDYLGPNFGTESDKLMIRAFLPRATAAKVCITQPIKQNIEMNKIHPDGLFEILAAVSSEQNIVYHYQITDVNNQTFERQDAYNFKPKSKDIEELSRFKRGEHFQLSHHFGAHPEIRSNIRGINFCLWAPHAKRVSVVGNFNCWDGRCHSMQKINSLGIWELFIPDAQCGDFYKFEIKASNGELFLKTDPFAFQAENNAAAAGIVADLSQLHVWKDSDWCKKQRHEPTWLTPRVFKLDNKSQDIANGSLLAFEDEEIISLKQHGYTHIELTNLNFLDGGITTYFAPNPKIGTPKELMDFVDRCHRHELGVIMNGLGECAKVHQNNLSCFDGQPLYEIDNLQDQNNFYYDTKNPGVVNFFLSHAHFWLETYHIDGFRLDLDNFMLYWNFTRTLAPAYDYILLLGYESDDAPSISAKNEGRQLFHDKLKNSFSVTGPHRDPGNNKATIRALLPLAQRVSVFFPESTNAVFEMQQIDRNGIWRASIPAEFQNKTYNLDIAEEKAIHYTVLDPNAYHYSHITLEDKALFAAGNHYRIYEKLGAHRQIVNGIEGVSFAVWAPNAAVVSVVVGPVKHWDRAHRRHVMKRHYESSLWELFIPEIEEGTLYKYSIRPHRGADLLKSDPFASYTETAPATASIVYQTENIYNWNDAAWLQQRSKKNHWRSPISAYEVHLASWMRGQNKQHLNYKEIAQSLIPYVKSMGFTHIEILPIAEHPYEPSWGYQVSNFYAPTSRLGKPEDLMAFIDQCHQQGIGVILDWVVGHFPKDAHALAQFDGTHLFEHSDPRQGEHKDWGTLIFNYGRHEVKNFLLANALFWLDRYHFDGLRVDAVASMLYLDYSRDHGEWIPNIYGGNENLEAIEFIKQTNSVVHAKFPGVMMMAEDSTAWPGVSRPTDTGGLGFDFKWNMGWMHDVLNYMQTPPEQRSFSHHRLLFVLQYAFDESFILSLSHDEVVHLKKSLLRKMPGNAWGKFANLRLLFFFMYTHPGKKLNFMGSEFAQIEEWSESGELQWHLLESTPHYLLKNYMQRLNHFYCNEPALYEMDCRPAGFEWIDVANHEQSIIAFIRKAKEPRNTVIAVINFSAVSQTDFNLGVPFPVCYTEILNTNDIEFGGFSATASVKTYDINELPMHDQEFSINLQLPALSAILLKPAGAKPLEPGLGILNMTPMF